MPKDLTPEQRAKRREAAKRRREAKKNGTTPQATVVDLFGSTGARNDPDDVLPGGKDGPRPEHRKTRPRKRVRLSPNFTEVMDKVAAGETTLKEVVAAMDPEELVRGQFKAQDGTFKGRPPSFVPQEFHNECIRELLRRGQELYRSHFLIAIQAFTQIAADPEIDPAQRLKAAQYIWERVEGKVPERVEVAQAQPWQTIIDGIVAEAEDEAITRANRVLNGSAE
jgi:hypothetical protein